MNLDDFPYTLRWDMVRAYPVISGVPDPRIATVAQIEEGFRMILSNRHMLPTLQMWLDDERAKNVHTHDGVLLNRAIQPRKV